MFCIHLLVCLQQYMISPILCCVDLVLFCFVFYLCIYLFYFIVFFEELKPKPPLVIHFLGQNQHWSVCSLADFERVWGENADSFPWLVFPEVLIWIPTHWVSFMPQWWWLQLVKCFAESTLFLLPPAVEWPRPQWLLSNRFQWWMSGFVLLVCAAWRYCSRWQ